jgi:hypothetical protein
MLARIGDKRDAHDVALQVSRKPMSAALPRKSVARMQSGDVPFISSAAVPGVAAEDRRARSQSVVTSACSTSRRQCATLRREYFAN